MFWNNPLPPTPRKVTVMCVNVCKNKFTCTNVTPKIKKLGGNGGHFTPHALSCTLVKAFKVLEAINHLLANSITSTISIIKNKLFVLNYYRIKYILI